MRAWLILGFTGLVFVLGVGLGSCLSQQLARPVTPVYPRPVAPASAAPTPGVTAQAATSTKVIIRRPVTPASVGSSVVQSGATEAVAVPVYETIEVVVQASAGAAVVPATPAPDVASTLGPWSLLAGSQPGVVALGYEVITWHGVGGLPVRAGALGFLGAQSVGLGGNLGLEVGLPRLYLTVGAAQRFGGPFAPVPFVGLGWRL